MRADCIDGVTREFRVILSGDPKEFCTHLCEHCKEEVQSPIEKHVCMNLLGMSWTLKKYLIEQEANKLDKDSDDILTQLQILAEKYSINVRQFCWDGLLGKKTKIVILDNEL